MNQDKNTNISSDWPFDDPPNVAVITTKRIMHGGYPILLVIREDE